MLESLRRISFPLAQSKTAKPPTMAPTTPSRPNVCPAFRAAALKLIAPPADGDAAAPVEAAAPLSLPLLEPPSLDPVELAPANPVYTVAPSVPVVAPAGTPVLLVLSMVLMVLVLARTGDWAPQRCWLRQSEEHWLSPLQLETHWLPHSVQMSVCF